MRRITTSARMNQRKGGGREGKRERERERERERRRQPENLFQRRHPLIRRGGPRRRLVGATGVNVALRVPPKPLIFSSAVKCLLSDSPLRRRRWMKAAPEMGSAGQSERRKSREEECEERIAAKQGHSFTPTRWMRMGCDSDLPLLAGRSPSRSLTRGDL